MISKSTISITQADMQTALAYWLNATAMKEPVRVTNIKTTGQRGYGSEHFTLTVERAETPADNVKAKEPQ